MGSEVDLGSRFVRPDVRVWVRSLCQCYVSSQLNIIIFVFSLSFLPLLHSAEQMKQMQMAQQPQGQLSQQHQQQLLNQVMQQQSQNQMMQQQSQQMQALEEQKLRYSIMLQKNLQSQDQRNGPGLASSQHLLQQHQLSQQPKQLYPTIDTSQKSNQQIDRRSSLVVGSRASASPTNMSQGPSPQPNSQFAQVSSITSSHDDSTEFSFPFNTFYRPLSTSANKRQMDRRTSTSAAWVQQSFNTPEANDGASARPSFSNNVESNESLPTQQKETIPLATGKVVGKKTPPPRRQSQTQPTSALSYEEVAHLVHQCTTEQKILWVARQVGSNSTNGFQKSTSTLQRMKRQRARACKYKEGAELSKDEAEEKLKLDTFDARVAKRMYIEMRQGLQYCNLMTGVVRKILEDIDPENPILLVKPPVVCFDDSPR